MPGHAKSYPDSGELCDRLFDALDQRIENLQNGRSASYCGFFQMGRKRFAYIDHSIKSSWIEVWCLGDPEKLKESSHLDIKTRKPSSAGFGADFQARFYVRELSQIEDAAQLLYLVSYQETLK